MQTLIFNTTTKTAEIKLIDGTLKIFENIPTVAIVDGYYEVRQIDSVDEKRYPVFRLPIASTNMEIKR